MTGGTGNRHAENNTCGCIEDGRDRHGDGDEPSQETPRRPNVDSTIIVLNGCPGETRCSSYQRHTRGSRYPDLANVMVPVYTTRPNIIRRIAGDCRCTTCAIVAVYFLAMIGFTLMLEMRNLRVSVHPSGLLLALLFLVVAASGLMVIVVSGCSPCIAKETPRTIPVAVPVETTFYKSMPECTPTTVPEAEVLLES